MELYLAAGAAFLLPLLLQGWLLALGRKRPKRCASCAGRRFWGAPSSPSWL